MSLKIRDVLRLFEPVRFVVDILNNIFIDSIGLPLLRTSELKRLQFGVLIEIQIFKKNEDLKKVEAVGRKAKA